jgi:uncharacterized protein
MALTTGRITTLDAVRGFAVMGILLMNIVSFGMPDYAYISPLHYGGADGANWWSWAINYALTDGKMRGLFTMMFGASTVLIAEGALAKGERPAHIHYARMGSLFVIGMVHAYFIWAGDILVLYAVCGAIAFAAWRWRTRVLLAVGAGLLLLQLLIGLGSYAGLSMVRVAAEAPGATAADVGAWAEARAAITTPPETAAEDLVAHRGRWIDVHRARTAFAYEMQTQILVFSIPDTIGLMLIGMALYRLGFFSGAWSRKTYWQIASAGLAVIPLYVPLIRWIDATQFSPVTLLATDAIQLVFLRPVQSLAWASFAILFMQSTVARWLADRLAAAGRMAFSNYLGTSIVCTLIFYGYGLGWYGYLERWQLYLVVLGVWALILLWSKPWLDHFRYGPFEWLWRSMARLEWQAFRKP